jgi:hypothetical protein
MLAPSCAHLVTEHSYASYVRSAGFDVVLILDDSGSMNTPLANQTGNAFAPQKTRWAELKQTVQIIIDIAAVLDKDGVDLYFLNRATVLNVTSSAQVEAVFANPPAGLTPTTPVVQSVLAAKRAVAAEKKVLMIIATVCPHELSFAHSQLGDGRWTVLTPPATPVSCASFLVLHVNAA